MAKYYKPKDRGDGWTEWIRPKRRGYKLCCCDCGLVHNVNFRVRAGAAELQMERNNRSTALVRRHNGIRVRLD